MYSSTGVIAHANKLVTCYRQCFSNAHFISSGINVGVGYENLGSALYSDVA